MYRELNCRKSPLTSKDKCTLDHFDRIIITKIPLAGKNNLKGEKRARDKWKCDPVRQDECYKLIRAPARHAAPPLASERTITETISNASCCFIFVSLPSPSGGGGRGADGRLLAVVLVAGGLIIFHASNVSRNVINK